MVRLTSFLCTFAPLAVGLLLYSGNSLATSNSKCHQVENLQKLEKYKCLGKSFYRQAQKVFRNEPFLYHNSKFKDVQKWTRSYQKSLNKYRESVRHSRNTNASLKKYFKEYEILVSVATTLVRELPEQLEFHAGFYVNDDDFKIWRKKLRKTLLSILPESKLEETLRLPVYDPHDCDYITQPMNTLWLTLNASLIIDLIASEKYGQAWQELKKDLEMETFSEQEFRDSIKTLAEMTF